MDVAIFCVVIPLRYWYKCTVCNNNFNHREMLITHCNHRNPQPATSFILIRKQCANAGTPISSPRYPQRLPRYCGSFGVGICVARPLQGQHQNPRNPVL
ncbi:hypothetical protein DPMN_192968 [Dreissena polymorpha]|uniref:C2H2-type domain-containing protein n=1 Tax=Dreissena polymorpha TaxID=45954 RepID=A0A9D3Y0K7_DREPO|nr:hypothetical protein DPMN_192968 [Dreissena polymorpha]